MIAERLAPGVALTLCFRRCCGADWGERGAREFISSSGAAIRRASLQRRATARARPLYKAPRAISCWNDDTFPTDNLAQEPRRLLPRTALMIPRILPRLAVGALVLLLCVLLTAPAADADAPKAGLTARGANG